MTKKKIVRQTKGVLGQKEVKVRQIKGRMRQN